MDPTNNEMRIKDMYHPRLQGTHYDMGLHYGSLLYKNGVSFDSVIQLTDAQTVFGIASLRICETIIPNICEEIKGLAEGLHFSYEKFAAWLLSMYGFGDEHGCTCFCFQAAGKTVFARNSDMFPSLKPTSESILYRPEPGYIFLGHSTAMVSIEDGINENGLAAGMTFLLSKQMKPGLHSGFLIRHILETCRTVNEAVNLLNALPISSTQNIVLADKTGDMAVVECNSQKIAIRRPVDGKNFLVAANHFVDNAMQNEHANPVPNWYHSNERYETVNEALSKDEIVYSVNYAQEILSGKHGFMCQYEKDLNFDTLWSVVYDLQDLQVLCAEGNPSKTKYKEDTRLLWGISKSR